MSTSTSYSSSSTTGCTPLISVHDTTRGDFTSTTASNVRFRLAIQDHGERLPGDRGAGREAEHVALGGLLQHDRREPGPLRKLRHRGEQLRRRLDLGGAQGIERMLGCGCSLGRDRRGGGLGRPDGHDDEGGTSQQDDGGAAEEGHARIIAELAEPALAPRVSGIAPAFAGSHQPAAPRPTRGKPHLRRLTIPASAWVARGPVSHQLAVPGNSGRR